MPKEIRLSFPIDSKHSLILIVHDNPEQDTKYYIAQPKSEEGLPTAELSNASILAVDRIHEVNLNHRYSFSYRLINDSAKVKQGLLYFIEVVDNNNLKQVICALMPDNYDQVKVVPAFVIHNEQDRLHQLCASIYVEFKHKRRQPAFDPLATIATKWLNESYDDLFLQKDQDPEWVVFGFALNRLQHQKEELQDAMQKIKVAFGNTFEIPQNSGNDKVSDATLEGHLWYYYQVAMNLAEREQALYTLAANKLDESEHAKQEVLAALERERDEYRKILAVLTENIGRKEVEIAKLSLTVREMQEITNDNVMLWQANRHLETIKSSLEDKIRRLEEDNEILLGEGRRYGEELAKLYHAIQHLEALMRRLKQENETLEAGKTDILKNFYELYASLKYLKKPEAEQAEMDPVDNFNPEWFEVEQAPEAKLAEVKPVPTVLEAAVGDGSEGEELAPASTVLSYSDTDTSQVAQAAPTTQDLAAEVKPVNGSNQALSELKPAPVASEDAEERKQPPVTSGKTTSKRQPTRKLKNRRSRVTSPAQETDLDEFLNSQSTNSEHASGQINTRVEVYSKNYLKTDKDAYNDIVKSLRSLQAKDFSAVSAKIKKIVAENPGCKTLWLENSEGLLYDVALRVFTEKLFGKHDEEMPKEATLKEFSSLFSALLPKSVMINIHTKHDLMSVYPLLNIISRLCHISDFNSESMVRYTEAQKSKLYGAFEYYFSLLEIFCRNDIVFAFDPNLNYDLKDCFNVLSIIWLNPVLGINLLNRLLEIIPGLHKSNFDIAVLINIVMPLFHLDSRNNNIYLYIEKSMYDSFLQGEKYTVQECQDVIKALNKIFATTVVRFYVKNSQGDDSPEKQENLERIKAIYSRVLDFKLGTKIVLDWAASDAITPSKKDVIEFLTEYLNLKMVADDRYYGFHCALPNRLGIVNSMYAFLYQEIFWTSLELPDENALKMLNAWYNFSCDNQNAEGIENFALDKIFIYTSAMMVDSNIKNQDTLQKIVRLMHLVATLAGKEKYQQRFDYLKDQIESQLSKFPRQVSQTSAISAEDIAGFVIAVFRKVITNSNFAAPNNDSVTTSEASNSPVMFSASGLAVTTTTTTTTSTSTTTNVSGSSSELTVPSDMPSPPSLQRMDGQRSVTMS